MENTVAILKVRIGGLSLEISISSSAWKYYIEWDDFYKKKQPKNHSVREGKNIRRILIDDVAITVQILFIFSKVYNESHELLPLVILKPVLVLYQLSGLAGGMDTAVFLPIRFPFP